jgi:hypothetical protein
VLAALVFVAVQAGASCGGGSEAPRGGSPTTLTKWDLWSQGVELRGANIWQGKVDLPIYGGIYGSGPYGPPFAQQDFTDLASAGANFVNVSHPGLFTVDAPYALAAGSQQNLDALLAKIAQADLFAVITMRTGPGRSEFTFHWGNDTTTDPVNGWFPASLYNEAVWTDQAAQDAWVAMWRHIGDRYKGNPVVVAYDLMCEPNGNLTQHGAGDPSEFYPARAGGMSDWNLLFPRIIAAIREVDSQTPIIVGGMGYSGPDWLPFIQTSTDTKVVYAVHQYEPAEYTHQSATAGVGYPGNIGGNQVDKAALTQLLQPISDFRVARNAPIVCNECGLHRWAPNAALFMDDQLDVLEQMGAGHAVWDWEPPVPVLDGEQDPFNFRFGPDPASISEVHSNALFTVYKEYWARNRYRPSDMPPR